MGTATMNGEDIALPGIATAHSHAFQRALRGRVQRRTTGADSFWSWRGLMYDLASKLDPDSIYDISRFAYMELARSGVTAVGEFHYVHHDRDGAPYGDRTILADAVIRAARDVGLRIALLRV
ncbi:MAG: amidohydrolase family protein, partial [Myxococcales bacterium]|nr:amidohydrolase family protein [Myxococcales bacterium]